MIKVSVLGPVAVWRDGERLRLPSGLVTELLVRLALEAGQPVRAERITEDLWPGEIIGRNTLQAKVSGLRRALGDPELLTSGPDGYTLHLDPADVDALSLLEAAKAGEQEWREGWRGEVLVGAGDREWMIPWRGRVEAARASLVDESLSARVQAGPTAGLVDELEAAVAAEPLRERRWVLLVTALSRAGRPADALDAYQRARRTLADELGLDPGPELREAERRILTRNDVPGNLPGLSSSLIGRSDALVHIATTLEDHRLVTLTGPAGVGKTRLAIEVARRATPSGGHWLARLDSATDDEQAIWRAVAEAFGLAEPTRPVVLERIRTADLLLVLDNCEHLPEALPGIVEEILAVATVTVLATSQRPIGLDGEKLVAVEPLAPEDAVELFTVRSRRAVDREAQPVVGRVCEALDRLPLAIELAAARTKVLSVSEIERRLADRFTLLNDPGTRRPARQRALATAIAWSYDLLFPDDQRGLWALAGFSGGAPIGAFEHVLTVLGVPAPATVDVLDRLVERSLVLVEPGDRYRLLDSVRAFSEARARDGGSSALVRAAHAAWFAEAAGRCAAGIRGPGQAGLLELARAERANIDAALAWAAEHDPALGTRIAGGFGWAWAILGLGPDGARRIRAALAAAPASTPGRAEARFIASWLEAAGGDVGQAERDVEEALAEPADGDEGVRVRAVGGVYLAFVRTQQGRPGDVLKLLDSVLGELRRLGLTWEEGAAQLLVAWASTALGDMARARAACAGALRVMDALGDDWARIHASALLGGLALAEGRGADAVHNQQEAAEAAGRLGFAAARALHLTNLGLAQHSIGRLEEARDTLTTAVDEATATGDLRAAALARTRLGAVLNDLGESTAARETVETARRWYRTAGGGEGADQADALAAQLDLP